MAQEGTLLCPDPKDLFLMGLNRFIQQYRKLLAVPLAHLGLRFCRGVDSFHHVDTCIRSAVETHVKSLTVSLKCKRHRQVGMCPSPNHRVYMFPCQLLNKYPVELEKLFLQGCIFSCYPVNKLAANTLEMSDTILTRHDMPNILHCLPGLKRLVMYHITSPPKLTLTGASLTCSRIQFCKPLRQLQLLDNPSFTAFTYSGAFIKFNCENNPKLTPLTYWTMNPEGVDYVFQDVHRDLPALTSLSVLRQQ